MPLSGPMIEPSMTDIYESVHKQEGAHYNVFRVKTDMREAALRAMFPDGEANEMNLVLFSTSGVHGSYLTIEDCEVAIDDPDECSTVTFLIVQPRLVCMRYGNVEVTRENVDWLKKLRASSMAVVPQIGIDPAKET